MRLFTFLLSEEPAASFGISETRGANMFALRMLSAFPALLANQSKASAARSRRHLGFLRRPSVAPLIIIFVLLLAQSAHAGDTKTFTFTNHTGQTATDLHITFRGTGGNVTINPITIVNPAKCDQGIPSSSGNAVDIIWQPQGCVENNSTVSFTVTTNGPGPLEFGEGYWTGPGAVAIGAVRPGDVEVASTPNYRLAVPDLAEEGEHFTGMVVEETPNGDVSVTPSDQVVFNGQVIPPEPGGKYAFPPFEHKQGNYFIGVLVVPRTVTPEKAHTISLPSPTQHMEILPAPSKGQLEKPQIAHASDVIAPGALLRVEGNNLERLQKAALVDDHSNQIPLGDSAGSSLQRIYLPPADKPIPPGAYHYVAWDNAGNRFDSPNISQRPRLQLAGPQIKKRGQQGEFSITSDTTGMVELSGGEPIISLQEHSFAVHANEPRNVKFTAREVGQYTLNARLFNPEDLPLSAKASKVDSKPGPVSAYYDPKTNKTTVDAPITVTDATGHPVSNVQIDTALTHPGGVEYARLTTDNQGRASLTRTLTGDVPAKAVTSHVYRVLEHNWKEPDGGTSYIGFGIPDGLKCPHECKPPEVGPCTLDHIHVTLDAGEGKSFDIEETNRNLDFIAVMEGIASVIEPSPASGAAGATLGTAEAAKGLVEQIDKQKDNLKQFGAVTITLFLQRSYCVSQVCYFWPKKQEFWKKEFFDQDVDPPAGLQASEKPDKWVGANFDLRDPNVRQAVMDAYKKALKKCEGTE
jgi:hypothetical protein